MRRGRQLGLIIWDRQVRLLGSQPMVLSGAVAQLGEHLDGIEKVVGSIPFRSTTVRRGARWGGTDPCKIGAMGSIPMPSTIALVVQRKNASSVRRKSSVQFRPRAPSSFAGVAEWLGPGPPTQSREFDSPRPLQVECSAGSTSLGEIPLSYYLSTPMTRSLRLRATDCNPVWGEFDSHSRLRCTRNSEEEWPASTRSVGGSSPSGCADQCPYSEMDITHLYER